MRTREDFRVGDKVFCFGFGNGVVKTVRECSEDDYPLYVAFRDCDDNYETCYFTSDGRRYLDEKRCLFHGEMPIIPPEWIEVEDKPNINDLKIDDKIMVKCNRDTCWIKRFFAGISEDNEKVLCFLNGANSWTSNLTSEWDEWRLPTEEELK